MILSALVKGMSMRSISRTAGVSINTVTKLQGDAGKACAAYHDATVADVKANHVQCDEIWSFVYAKEKNVATAGAAPDGAGDVWTWTAIERNHKMILAYGVGDAPLHPPYKQVQQETGKPPAHAVALLRALQLRAGSKVAAHDTGDGRWCH